MEGSFTTRDSSGYRDWPQSNVEKLGAVKDKLFPAFISRRSAAQLAVYPCNDKQYSLSVFKAQRSTARRGVWWGRTLSVIASHRLFFFYRRCVSRVISTMTSSVAWRHFRLISSRFCPELELKIFETNSHGRMWVQKAQRNIWRCIEMFQCMFCDLY